jgi:hypothetical protein
LSSLSTELDALIASPGPVTLDQTKYANISQKAFEGLLKYLYFKDIQGIKLLYACQLHQWATDFKLIHLVQVIQNQLENLECDHRSAVYLLQVAYIELVRSSQIGSSL